MLKTVTAVFIILHGVTHTILALVPSSKDPDPGFAMFYPGLGSNLLNGLKLSPVSIKIMAIVISVMATIGFTAAGLALFDLVVTVTWRRVLAIVSSLVSMVLLLIFWDKMLIIGLIIDIVILATLLFTSWTPA